MRMLAERLGFSADARLLIVNCDDLGVTPAATAGVLAALTRGVATDATLMAPCPQAASAAEATREFPVGVHLTLTCEWDDLRWGPLTDAASLCRPEGGMYRSVRGMLDRARPAEVLAELRAQVEAAHAWGVDVTHLDAHMYALHDHEDLFEVYLDLAREFDVPVRLTGRDPTPFRQRAAERGVVAPDHLVALTRMGSRQDLTAALQQLPAGVTEFHAHPSMPCDLPDSAAREDDLALYVDPAFREAIDNAGAELISYRRLRDLMRS